MPTHFLLYVVLLFGMVSCQVLADNIVKIDENDRSVLYIDADYIEKENGIIDVYERVFLKVPIITRGGMYRAIVNHASYNCYDKTRMLIGVTKYADDALKKIIEAVDYSGGGKKYISPGSSDRKALSYLCDLDLSKSGTSPSEKNSTESGGVVINLVKSGGVYEVPVVINGVLMMNFIIDSGASDVSISSDVASTLVKAGTVGYDDWLPGKVYQFADGSYAKSRRFVIRSLNIGGRYIYDVTCSISESTESPLLLGVSALEKIGSYRVDYQSGYIIIY